ncbi:MAG TPA: hypothetical protein VEQ85_13350, partial [Lacipirellulaceae bacterium]|nr:hypothetical protein [Lacipirellulaceae bacterium]
MAILIGVDEAGYGPNYGPLCVAASAWSVDPQAARGRQHDEVEAQASPAVVRQRAGSSPSPAARAGSSLLAGSAARAGSPLLAKRRAAERDGTPDLYKLLKKCVARAPDKAGRKLAIADSKALYSPQTGVRQLERGVLAALVALEHRRAPSPRDRGCVRRVAD